MINCGENEFKILNMISTFYLLCGIAVQPEFSAIFADDEPCIPDAQTNK